MNQDNPDVLNRFMSNLQSCGATSDINPYGNESDNVDPHNWASGSWAGAPWSGKKIGDIINFINDATSSSDDPNQDPGN
jgi:hypothetical protein